MSLTIGAVLVATAFSGGCAKHQLVKQDQIIPPAPVVKPVQPAAPVAQEVQKPALPTATVDESQIKKEADLAAASNAASASDLKSGLDKVFFDFDSSTLSADARQTLTKNAEQMKKIAKGKIQIQGNCDELGSDEYNLALGEKRAKAAYNYLKDLGIPADRLATISYGKEKPADPGHDDAARAKNRRDEFVLLAN